MKILEDSVKYIFKTLIKVPVIIAVAYFVFNLFAFTITYFKVLGLSYTAMQVAVENNYIPETEKNTLTAYAADLTNSIEMIDNFEIGCDTNLSNDIECTNILGPEAATENRREQYGTPMTITVGCHYRVIWPLMPTQQKSNGVAVEGLNNSYAPGADLTDAQLEALREDIADNPQNNIVITYTVPGLKYYPDLS